MAKHHCEGSEEQYQTAADEVVVHGRDYSADDKRQTRHADAGYYGLRSTPYPVESVWCEEGKDGHGDDER